ncbi:MAG: BlaI/MecI/CopY family transcriptional regulator [Solirubrobacteraceae bacterium]
MTTGPKPAVPPALHAFEAEIMDQVWRHGSTTVRRVLEALNAAGAKQRAYTTVLTTMIRLDAKGLLQRRREGKTDVYEAVRGRQEHVDLRAEAEVSALVERHGEVALMQLVRRAAGHA